MEQFNRQSSIVNRQSIQSSIERRDFLGAIALGAWRTVGFARPNSEQAQPPTSPFGKQTFTFKQVQDCDIQADVYRPPVEGVTPVLIWIHGGALIMGHRQNINRAQLDRYLNAGYTVVSIDYRLAPETKLKEILDDIQDANRWVRQRGPDLFRIDPDRLAVIGHSAGGYLTLASGFLFRPRPRALVSFYGYGDIAGAWYSRPDPFYSKQPAVSKEDAYGAVGGRVISGTEGPNQRGRFYLYCRQQGLWPREVAGHDPDTEPKAFDRLCPVRNVTKDYPPTLLLHGDKDTDVPYEQSVVMAEKLSRAGVEHELITIRDGGHGFDRKLDDPPVAQAFDRALAFLQRHLS
jgi:acetyl esterase/lipase